MAQLELSHGAFMKESSKFVTLLKRHLAQARKHLADTADLKPAELNAYGAGCAFLKMCGAAGREF